MSSDVKLKQRISIRPKAIYRGLSVSSKNVTLIKSHIENMTYMDALNRQVDVVEEFIVVLDGHAGGEEDHHLLLSVLFQESKKQQKSFLGRAHDIPLKKHKDYSLFKLL